VPGVPTVALPI
jgi:hypothetical protein